jgi:hypothetical protein
VIFNLFYQNCQISTRAILKKLQACPLFDIFFIFSFVSATVKEFRSRAEKPEYRKPEDIMMKKSLEEGIARMRQKKQSRQWYYHAGAYD